MVLKHRQLVRTALRDEKTLAELEVQLQDLNLDQAVKPILGIDLNPNCSGQARGAAQAHGCAGLAWRLVLGCMAALVRDLRSGLVFSEDELKALLSGSMLERLPHWTSDDGKTLLSCWFKSSH